MTENTSKKYDEGKLRYDLFPPEAYEAIVEVITHGSQKYGDNNWQTLDDFENRFYAALERHIQAWRKGEKIDESGLTHLSHVACNAVFLLYNELKKVKDAENK